METTVSFVPLLNLVLTYLIEIAVVVFGVFILPYLQRLIGLKIDAERRAVIDQALSKALHYGVGRAQSLLENRVNAVDVKNAAIADAVSYTQARIPETLAHFKIGPEDLRKMLEARYGDQGRLIEGTTL